MTQEELKTKVQEWVEQIGVYNEGCMCESCTRTIKNEISLMFDVYINSIKPNG